MPTLHVTGLRKSFGTHVIYDGVSFRLPPGERLALIGRNGSGKTTLLRTISGFLKPISGTIAFSGQSIVGEKPHKIARLRVAHVPEGRHVFPDQSVSDNLLLGAFSRRGSSPRNEIESDYESVFETFPRLKERRKQLAGTLSGGEQQMLAIGRALMLRPKMILLDEPSMGLAPLLIDEVFRRLRDLKTRGITMLLVEQLAYRALEVADYAYVIENGKIQLEGPANVLQNDPRVREAYLGGAASR